MKIQQTRINILNALQMMPSASSLGSPAIIIITSEIKMKIIKYYITGIAHVIIILVVELKT